MELISPRFTSRKQGLSSSKALKRTQGIATEFEEFTEKCHYYRIRMLNIPSQESAEKELQELYDSLPRFGPFFDGVDSLMWRLKESAWQHLLFRSPILEPETTKIYTSAMQRIGRQARNAYPDESEVHQSPRFISMMVKDGCYILQIALFLLGGSAHLNYPSDHLIFREQRNTKVGQVIVFHGKPGSANRPQGADEAKPLQASAICWEVEPAIGFVQEGIV